MPLGPLLVFILLSLLLPRLIDRPSDEYCPHCDNHYVLDAKTAKPALQFEGEDARMDARMLKDDRVKDDEKNALFDLNESADRLG